VFFPKEKRWSARIALFCFLPPRSGLSRKAAAAIIATITTGTVAAMNKDCLLRKLRRMGMPFVLVVCMVAGLPTMARSAEQGNVESFAKCLAEKKATMYGSFLCAHCDDQKNLFGSSFRYVPYVECSIRGSRLMTFACTAAQIRYTPTWIFDDGERRVGLQSLKGLSEKTGCKLP
jgi:hypothetical protein